MKKFVTLFTDSCQELKNVRTITISAMFAAIAIVLGMFSINIGTSIRIGFATIPNGLTSYLFGPVVGGIFAGVVDILKYIVKPVGTFFPPLTLVTILAGILYGIFYYKKPLTLPRILAAKFVVMLLCNVCLNTLCLAALYNEVEHGFWRQVALILPARALKNLIMWPIDSVIFYTIAKALERVGVLKIAAARRGQK